MPNWCFNKMSVWTDGSDGSHEQLMEFKDTTIVNENVVKDNGEIDSREKMTFQGVIPRPKSLEITSGSAVEDAMALIRAKAGDLKDVKSMIKNRNWMHEGKNAIFHKKDKVKDKVQAIIDYLEENAEINDLTEAKIALNNIKEHGAKDWYDWSIRNWGCKWEPSLNHWDHWDDSMELDFETPWSPPEPWIHAVSKKFPNLMIKVHVTEESDAYMGIITANNGQMVPNFVDIHWPEPTTDQ